ncbi:hydroxyethylthiazole kinase [Lactonifactor longoviformis]|uniref:hydroxyethylthiazole kinase n=1 Tax=Lactonifactor longoviformis TaxID=341220 RepID=UPI0036F21918
MLGEMLENVRKKSPLIQNITNYVTANDCANITLACGASPTMSDGEEEAVEMATLCDGLNINMGTLHPRSIKAMLLAGKQSNVCGHPVVLDPVGAGASSYRMETAAALLSEIQFAAIRGNISEIKTLANGKGSSKGVDADAADAITEDTLPDMIAFAKEYAGITGAVIAVSGAIDIVSDSKKAYVIRNGHSVMAQITGCGCMLSSLTAAYLAANPEHHLEAAAAAFIAMGLCGQLAYDKMAAQQAGNSSCRNYLIDAVYHLTGEQLERGANYELY